MQFIAKPARNEVKLHNVPYLFRGLTTPDNVTRYRIVAIMSSSEATMTKMTREMAMTRHSYTVSSSSSPVSHQFHVNPNTPSRSLHWCQFSKPTEMHFCEWPRPRFQATKRAHKCHGCRTTETFFVRRPKTSKNLSTLTSRLCDNFLLSSPGCARVCVHLVCPMFCVSIRSQIFCSDFESRVLRPALGHHRWRSVVFGFDVEISLADVFWWSTDIKFLKHICTLSGGREKKRCSEGLICQHGETDTKEHVRHEIWRDFCDRR